jgi:hypothetical protein
MAELASGSSSAVEHFLAKEDVEGSNPFSRSTPPPLIESNWLDEAKGKISQKMTKNP